MRLVHTMSALNVHILHAQIYTYLSNSPSTHLPLDVPMRYGRMMVFTSL